MKFILIDNTDNGKQQEVTRECVDRVKGKAVIDSLITKAQETGMSVDTHFEGNNDLRIIR